MDEIRDKRKKTESGATKRNVLAILLIVLFMAVLVVASILVPAAAGCGVSIGFVSEPGAYNGYELSRILDSNYSVIVFDGYNDMISALNSSMLDAALLPVRYLGELRDDICAVAAVTSYMNLVAVENGSTVFSIYDLNERQVVVPESLEGTPEHQMLDALACNAGVSLSLHYASDEVIAQMVRDKSFDVMMLRADQYASVLTHRENGRVSFELADQWTVVSGCLPPAGSCLVVRHETMDEKPTEISVLLAKLKLSVDLLKTSHKKAAAALAASGAADDFQVIWRTIPHCRFEFIEGESMAESLEQLQNLRQGAAR